MKPPALQSTRPLYSFEDSCDYVYDSMWSPTHPALFACVDLAGRLDLWNLNNDTEVGEGCWDEVADYFCLYADQANNSNFFCLHFFLYKLQLQIYVAYAKTFHFLCVSGSHCQCVCGRCCSAEPCQMVPHRQGDRHWRLGGPGAGLWCRRGEFFSQTI